MIVDPEALRNAEFKAALIAATPRIFVTPALVVINVAVFLAMVASGVSALHPSSEALIRWGALFGPLTLHGQWWRTITAVFVHVGLLHLLLNMSVLWSSGALTERLFGNAAFAVLYVLAGLFGSLASLAWHPLSVGAGASGAIFGIFGGLLGYLLMRHRSVPGQLAASLSLRTAMFVALNLAYSLTNEHIDVAAHLGGFIAGIPLGCALAAPMTGDVWRARLQRSAVTCIVVLASAGVIAKRMPGVDDWPAELKRFAALNQNSSLQYRAAGEKVTADRASVSAFADLVETRLLPPWEAEKIRLAALRVPATEKRVANQLVAYMGATASAWKLTAESLRTNDKDSLTRAKAKFEEATRIAQALPWVAHNTGAAVASRRTPVAADALAVEMKRIGQVEAEAAAVYNESLKKVQAHTLRPQEWANAIETRMLPPWDAERQNLLALELPERQQPTAKRLREYMTLKGDAWRLAAAALRKNDAALMKQAAAKQRTASQLAQQLAAERKP